MEDNIVPLRPLETIQCKYCTNKAVAKVGFGPNPIQVCQSCLDEWLDVDI